MSTEASPRFKARMAGLCWLMTILTGSLAMLASGRLAVLTVSLLATASYVAATLLVYGLLKPVNRRLSLLAAFFSLLGCAIGALSGVLHLAQASRLHFVFFGLHCFLVGYLILRSTFLPRFVGALMALGGSGWLAYAFATLLPTPIRNSLSPYFMMLGILGEVSLTLWLLLAGVNSQRWKEQDSGAEKRLFGNGVRVPARA
jgi:uncharacterized protein DUF4386